MTGPRIGSLCTGYGGLDHAVQAVFGGRLAWTSDIDPGAAQIIAHHHPGIPNLGDLTVTDWAAVEPVDALIGGYPCQPFSNAGLRKGTEDERHIWPYIAHALGVLRPRIAIFENVAGHLRRGFDVVLADLARLGFDVEWACVRASEVGAPHARNRLFILAVASDAPNIGHERGWGPWDGRSGLAHGGLAAADPDGLVPGDDRELPAGRDALRHGVRDDAAGCGSAPADAGGPGLAVWGVEHHGSQLPAAERGRREPAADADGGGRRAGERDLLAGESDAAGGAPADAQGVGRDERRPEPARIEGGSGVASGGAPDWGSFAPAIHRWEAVTGRRAPRATDDRNRLSPVFVEWLMGLALGHVTAVPGLSRNQQLKALGNGVVPQQAEAAIRLLYARAFPAADKAAA